MRQFIRHPASIPISAEYLYPDHPEEIGMAQNIGVGGLAFTSGKVFDAGNILTLKIAQLAPPFETDARVVWSHPHGTGGETGVEFLSSDDAYRARMIEQICHIEAYRLEIAETEGRHLSPNEAAREWIEKYAPSFPAIDTEPNS